MKKLLCVILSLLTAVLCCVNTFAIDSSVTDIDVEDLTTYPVIMVAGYSSSPLHMKNEDGTYSDVWGLDFNKVLSKVYEKIPELALDIGMLGAGKAQYIGKTLGEELVNFTSNLVCNPDGTSKYEVSTYYTSPKNSSWEYLKKEYPQGGYRAEPEVGQVIADYVGDENMFNFNCDFRMGAVECATMLDTYVEAVKEYKNTDKVNIIAISHGGQVTGTYLSLFGYKNSVDNAVLIVPALGGAGFAYDAFSDKATLEEETLLKFIENGMMWENDFNWLVRANQLGFLDDIIHELLPYIKQVMLYWGSMWDFMPYKDYKEMIAYCLDPVESAELIEKTTYFHENIMNNYAQAFENCRNSGMNISIIAGTGTNIVTGLNENSDGIITVNGSTGAKTASYGKRFSDGYTGTGTVCTNPQHNHISPSMEIDATYCYMPENTWFIDGLFHGMEIKDKYATRLYTKLLLTDELCDIYSSSEFPQFSNSTNICYEINAYFSNSRSGYLSGNDKSFIIENISDKYTVKIASVIVDGIKLDLSRKTSYTIKPGEKAVYNITSEIPKVSGKRCAVTVTFITEGNYTPLASRTFDFTLLNGEPIAYDINNPYCDVDFVQGIKEYLSDETAELLEKHGLLDFINMIFNTFKNLIEVIKSLFSFIG